MGCGAPWRGTPVKILSVNTFFPCPPRRGMDLIYLNLLKLQSRDHAVTVVTMRRSEAEAAPSEDLPELRARVVFVEPRNTTSLAYKIWYRVLYSLLSVITWRPRCTFYGAPRELADEVRRLLATERFDLVEIHHSTSASLSKATGDHRTALYMYDVHFRAKARSAATKRGFNAFLARLGVSQFRHFEKRMLSNYDAILLGQEEDKAEVLRLIKKGPLVALMPNVIDTDIVRPEPSTESRPHTAIFVGAMTHQANIDAIMHFYQHIWPLIRERVTDAQWMIVGAWPPPEILALDGHQGVCVYSNVPDVKPFIRESAVYIAPLRIGSGVKVKIMEALAMGKAIVATPVAAEGMGLLNGRDIEVADLDSPFADTVVNLWQNDAARQSLELHARQCVVERFGFEAGARTLNCIYEQLR